MVNFQFPLSACTNFPAVCGLRLVTFTLIINLNTKPSHFQCVALEQPLNEITLTVVLGQFKAFVYEYDNFFQNKLSGVWATEEAEGLSCCLFLQAKFREWRQRWVLWTYLALPEGFDCLLPHCLLGRTTCHSKPEHPRDSSKLCQGQPGLCLAQGTDKQENCVLL